MGLVPEDGEQAQLVLRSLKFSSLSPPLTKWFKILGTLTVETFFLFFL